MADRSTELRTAIYDKLSVGTVPVEDIVSPDAPMPFINIGNEVILEDDSKTHSRTQHVVTIHAWTRSHSRAEINQLNEFIIQSLLDSNLQLDSYVLENATLEMQVIQNEANSDGDVYHDIGGTIRHSITDIRFYISN